MTETEFNAEMQKGFDDVASGRVKPATEAFSDIRKKSNCGWVSLAYKAYADENDT